MKRALILHGWSESPFKHWYQDEIKFLKKHGYQAVAPVMPGRWLNPSENAWVKAIEDFKPDHETILVGHSLGGTAILEYLERAEKKVDKVLLAATPIRYSEKLELDDPEGFKLYTQSVEIKCLLDTFGYDEIFDWEKIRNSAKSFHLVYKKNDFRVPADDGIVLAAKLNADLSLLPGKDHCDIVTMEELNAGLELR